jgi:hypothetical protein
VPGRRKGSSNPDGYDDPDWYEKPGETVLMNYRPHPSTITVPPLPWNADTMQARTERRLVERAYALNATCDVCGRGIRIKTLTVRTCDYCARAQQRHEENAAKQGSAA